MLRPCGYGTYCGTAASELARCRAIFRVGVLGPCSGKFQLFQFRTDTQCRAVRLCPDRTFSSSSIASCETMEYAIVEFTESLAVEIVPTIWISDDVCAWPHNVKMDRVPAMVKKQFPPLPSWKRYGVAVIGLFSTYENARKKISKSEYTSSLSSDPDHPPEKRRRRPPAKWTDDDDLPQIMPSAERASAAVPAIPDDFPQGLLSGQGPSATMSEQTDRFACEASTSSSAASNQSVILCQASTSSRQTCEGTSNRSVLLSQADNATSQSQKSFSAVSIDSISDNELEPSVREPVQKAFEQHVIRLLNTVRFMLHQHGDLLNKLCETVPSTTMSRHKVLISEPFSEMKQLLDFDEGLNNKKKEILVHEFSRLGGTDARWATKRIMAYCMDDSVASQLSWVGRKGKRSFCEMKIAKAVADAVCLLPDATTATVEANIKSWLRHAPERWAAKVAKNRPGPDTEHQTTESEEA
ncbi:hypothetical protein MTO96_040801 [Rhipicephalus appendiculatus]